MCTARRSPFCRSCFSRSQNAKQACRRLNNFRPYQTYLRLLSQCAVHWLDPRVTQISWWEISKTNLLPQKLVLSKIRAHAFIGVLSPRTKVGFFLVPLKVLIPTSYSKSGIEFIFRSNVVVNSRKYLLVGQSTLLSPSAAYLEVHESTIPYLKCPYQEK